MSHLNNNCQICTVKITILLDKPLRNYYTTTINCELGEELINRYNYISYTTYIYEYQSFSLFKLNNNRLIIPQNMASSDIIESRYIYNI